jgi:hypothetical protein
LDFTSKKTDPLPNHVDGQVGSVIPFPQRRALLSKYKRVVKKKIHKKIHTKTTGNRSSEKMRPEQGPVKVGWMMVPKRTFVEFLGARLGEGKRPRSGHFPLSEPGRVWEVERRRRTG